MSWAAVDVSAGFTNLPKDYAPDGRVITFKYVKPQLNGELMTPEEREARKKESIALSRAKKLPNLEERQKAIEEIQRQIRERRGLLTHSPEELEWRRKHAEGWAQVGRMHDKYQKQQLTRELIADRKAHQRELAEKKKSCA
jgi:hypothetical protein